MFDLIDDLNDTQWEDKGTPPDDLNTIPDIGNYENCHIINRKPAPDPLKEITYVVADDAGKNPKNVIVKGTKIKDPLKNVRHFRALLTPVQGGDDNVYEASALLLDMDWVVKK